MRALSQMIIAGERDPSTALSLAGQCLEIDEHLVGGGLLPKDWEVGKKLTWRDGKGGSKVLDLNGVAVGHVMPAIPGDATIDDWMYSASLKPTQELPYRVWSKVNNDAGTLDEAKSSCERYVREQIQNVFSPWAALSAEGLI